MKLIDKGALVAEIEKLLRKDKYSTEYVNGKKYALKKILSFLDILEVKEVDLEKEVEFYWKQCDLTWCRDAYTMTHIRAMLSDIAKHFFELGMAVNNKAQKEL